MLVDTHCHLGDARFDKDRTVVVERAFACGVGHSIVIADSEPATRQAIALGQSYGLSASAGVHPHHASSWTAEVAESVEAALESPVVVAVGETGLDYHYDFSPRSRQRHVFAKHLELALRCGVPAVVHSRNADQDLIAMISGCEATLVLHSFCGGPQLAEAVLARNDYVSFSGMVTFNSWNDLETVRAVPANRLMAETDSPYLTPVPHRGKRNEPSFVVHVAEKLAEIRGVTTEEIARKTTENAIRCFGNRVDPTAKQG